MNSYFEYYASIRPLGEIAHAVIFLAENDFVTGTTVFVDGGYTAQ